MEQLINEINKALLDTDRWKVEGTNLIDKRTGVVYQYVYGTGYQLNFNGERIPVDNNYLTNVFLKAQRNRTYDRCKELFEAYNVKGE
jgi:hypothetical protein